MREFATLLDRLSYTPSRNAKLRLLSRLFPPRARSGARLGAGGAHRRPQPSTRSSRRRSAALAEARVDPVLFGWSYDYRRRPRRDGGADLAGAGRAPTASRTCPRWSRPCAPPAAREVPQLVEGWLDALDAHGPLGAAEADDRRAARRRLGAAGQDGAGGVRRRARSDEVEEVWHGLTPPYVPLFAWLERRGAAAGGGRPRRCSAR